MLLLFIGVFLSSGYRVAQSGLDRPMRWDISVDRPVLWVEVCDAVRSTEFDRMVFPDGDPLSSAYPSAEDIISSVFDDFNSVPGTFLELRWAGDEGLSNTTAPDLTWTSENAQHRTITVCTGSTDYTAAAHATPEGNQALCDNDPSFKQRNPSFCSNNNVALCKIVLGSDYIKGGTDIFAHVLTHELGHCLGLLHNHETKQSVMSYLGDRIKTIRLTIDDQMGIAWLYPRDKGQVKETVDFGLTACHAK
jgi:hypothetical protein